MPSILFKCPKKRLQKLATMAVQLSRLTTWKQCPSWLTRVIWRNLGKLARKTDFGGAPETKQTIDRKVTIEATPMKVQTDTGNTRGAPCDTLARREDAICSDPDVSWEAKFKCNGTACPMKEISELNGARPHRECYWLLLAHL